MEEAGVLVRVLPFQPLSFRGGKRAKMRPSRKTMSTNKGGGQTDGRTDGWTDGGPAGLAVSSGFRRGRHAGELMKIRMIRRRTRIIMRMVRILTMIIVIIMIMVNANI